MGNKILLLGGGGNCFSIIDTILENDFFDEIGIVDWHDVDLKSFGNKVKYVGTDFDLDKLKNSGWNYAFVSLGSIGDTSKRRQLYLAIKSLGFKIPNIISSSAIISPRVNYGEGLFVSKGAVINVNVKLGDCVIVNTNSTIEHDCEIGDFVHISSGSVLCGGVKVGCDSHIGAGAVVKQYLSIGKNTLVGIGSVVTKDLSSNATYYGNPAHLISDK